jgi:phosphohistidine phosphatase
MRLTLIRHARAEERDARKYPDDALRPLTPQGREEQALLAAALYRMGMRFDVLASSPLVRARETADILAEGMRWSGTIEITPLLGEAFTVNRLVEWLRRFPGSAHVACVGHEPDMSELAAALLSADEEIWFDFKKSGVLGIGFDESVARGQGMLLYFLPPKLLLALAR